MHAAAEIWWPIIAVDAPLAFDHIGWLKQRRLGPDDNSHFGDQYVFVALDAKAIVSYRVGKRDGSVGTTDQSGTLQFRSSVDTLHVTTRTVVLARSHIVQGDAKHVELIRPSPCSRWRSTVSVGLLRRCAKRIQRTEEYIWLAELHRIEGEVRRAAGHPLTDVEICYAAALEVSRRQGARMFELRAATSLARLWRDQGRRVEARDLLAPAYAWFIEGFDTVDLNDAKALLTRLNG
jgi:hypothetical protein